MKFLAEASILQLS